MNWTLLWDLVRPDDDKNQLTFVFYIIQRFEKPKVQLQFLKKCAWLSVWAMALHESATSALVGEIPNWVICYIFLVYSSFYIAVVSGYSI